MLPAPWNARTRVHEYGGGRWLAPADGTLVFTEFTDQRLYRLDAGLGRAGADHRRRCRTPVARATPTRSSAATAARSGACARSHAADGTITRDLCAVPVDGSAAEDPAAIRSLVGGSDFLANARLSPDGDRLAWIAWNHPQMPWDGTELRVAELAAGRQLRAGPDPGRLGHRVGDAAGMARQRQPVRDQRPDRLVEPVPGRLAAPSRR